MYLLRVLDIPNTGGNFRIAGSLFFFLEGNPETEDILRAVHIPN
jgi:hypothetical protein